MENARPLPSLHKGETTTITIDTASIPDRVRNDLAAATLEFIHGILRQPGGREMLDARTAARKEAQTAKRKE